MKSETEILGAIDELLAHLPDDAARERAFAWLRAKHAPKPRSAVTQRETPFAIPTSVPELPPCIGPVPQPHVPAHPDLGPTIWCGDPPGSISVADTSITLTPAGAGIAACNPIMPMQTVNLGVANAYPSSVHVGSETH